jgi:hypothetical protein
MPSTYYDAKLLTAYGDGEEAADEEVAKGECVLALPSIAGMLKSDLFTACRFATLMNENRRK